MRTINTITAEIVELNVVKSTYNHFLASHEAQAEVENATTISANKAIISASLKKLYSELDTAKATKQKAYHPTANNLKFKNHVATSREDYAIMHFNSDKRYRITE